MIQRELSHCSIDHIEESMDDIKTMNDIFALTVGFRDTPYQSLEKIFQEATPKTHGCIHAVFQINSDIPENLQTGIFSSLGKKYETVLQFLNKFSNKEGQENRQILIKICDVGGSVLAEDNGCCNQDFLMTSNALEIPSNHQFLSHSLFSFGSNKMVGFSIVPVNRTDLFEFSTHQDRSNSSDTLKSIIYQNELVEFDFMVQVREIEKDDMSEIIDEIEPSYIKVAKLTFSASQAAIDLISDPDYDNIVYNPLHSLTEHHPL